MTAAARAMATAVGLGRQQSASVPVSEVRLLGEQLLSVQLLSVQMLSVQKPWRKVGNTIASSAVTERTALYSHSGGKGRLSRLIPVQRGPQGLCNVAAAAAATTAGGSLARLEPLLKAPTTQSYSTHPSLNLINPAYLLNQ